MKLRIKFHNVQTCASLATFASLGLFSLTAEGAAKAPVVPSTCGPSQGTTPSPVRAAIVAPVGTKAFKLPNGAEVDLSIDLQTILTTEVANSTAFSPVDPNPSDPCQTHIEIRGAVTTMQLNIANAGINFGYTPGGDLGPITGINTSANVSVGVIQMDFSVWKCVGGQPCQSVGASTANQSVLGTNLSLQIDFGSITSGASFIYNTPIGNILRKIMSSGINQLSLAPTLDQLPWQASVREYIPSANLVIFDAGTASRIGPNQTFEIFAPTDSTASGVCNVFQVEAYVHTTTVNSVSSSAIVDQLFNGAKINPGDVVLVHKATAN